MSCDEENSTTIASNIPGWTILHAAVDNKSIEGVKFILGTGKDPNCKTEEDAWTPLWIAACHGHSDITRMLLDAGANVNATNRKGCTALREASQIGATEVVRLLLEHSANVDLAPHDFQDAPLIVAAAKDHIEVVKLLLAAGANVRAQQSGGWSPLHYALMNKNEEMATRILEYSPNVNASTLACLRPLHLAALAGLTDIATRLLDLGSEIEARDTGDLTALRVAVQAGKLDTVKMLVERGGRTDVVAESDGHSLTDVAMIFGHISVYQYLEEQLTR
jgi:ankyrin repeat protein